MDEVQRINRVGWNEKERKSFYCGTTFDSTVYVPGRAFIAKSTVIVKPRTSLSLGITM